MADIEKILNDLSAEEMSELLDGIDAGHDMLLSERIKQKALPQLTKEDKAPEVRERSIPRIFKIIPLAAALIIFVAGAVVAVSDLAVPSKQPETTTAEVTTQNRVGLFDNPLMLAISSGNESLIEKLLTNSILLSEEVLTFAIDCADVLSYTVIQEIAKAVEQNLGSTGLDALLESTLLGDSERALEELKERENMLMTPLEKLSFFFSAAFCDSEVINEFLSKGFDISLKDASGKDIFDIAEKYGNEENVKTAENLSE
ncbi:MAG: hypothetical protein IJW86_03130 [Clostridia bacterium]|nr:hypothetical protein [Clostridia bacterium]